MLRKQRTDRDASQHLIDPDEHLLNNLLQRRCRKRGRLAGGDSTGGQRDIELKKNYSVGRQKNLDI